MKVQLFSNHIFTSLLVSILLVACGKSSPSPENHMEEITISTSEVNSKGNNYIISFSPDTTKIPLNKYFNMEIQVLGASKQELNYPLELQIDAGMKAHNHGMNTNCIITPLGHGKFKLEGLLFHMPGNWFLRFTVSRGAITDKAEINILISP